MKHINYQYYNYHSLETFIKTNTITDDNLLIQVFTAVNRSQFIQELIEQILSLLPNAKIIGTTTSGEISTSGVHDYSTLIAFTNFQHTKLHTFFQSSLHLSSFQTGEKLFSQISPSILKNSKVSICFTDGLHMNGENFLHGIKSINNNLTISGGMAGDYSLFEKTFVFTQDEIIEYGAVTVILENPDLFVHTDYNFNWQSLGKSHKVQKSDNNRVYTIDDKTATDFYTYYLGEKILDLLPAIGIEFPLIIERNGIQIGRAVIETHSDGSLSFAGNIPEGSTIKFGHGNVSQIIYKSQQEVRKLLDIPTEAIFIYSCMARKALMGENIEMEIVPLSKIAPLCGFFTNGEFYQDTSTKNSQSYLLNETMTILALSENIQTDSIQDTASYAPTISKEEQLAINRTEALSNLILRTTVELESLTSNLEERVSIEIEKNNQKDKLLAIKQSQAEVGSILEMIVHQWRQPLNAISSAASGLKIKDEFGKLQKDDVSFYTTKILEQITYTNQTITDFRELFKDAQTSQYITPKNLTKKINNLLISLLNKNDIHLEESYTCEDGNLLYVPIGHMMQVLLILVKNSVDAIISSQSTEKNIFIRGYSQRDYCILEIEDTGGGVEENIKDKIFESRFSTKKDTHGTGLGLNIVKLIIEEKLHGQVTLKNGKKGAIFSLKLPSAIKD